MKLQFDAKLVTLLVLVIAPQAIAPDVQAMCPAAETVDARMREILGISATTKLAERIEVSREDGSLRVTLRGEGDRVLGDRVLPGEGNCEELARVAAVVLATWYSDVHPEYVGLLPAPISADASIASGPKSASVARAATAGQSSIEPSPVEDQPSAAESSGSTHWQWGFHSSFGVEMSGERVAPSVGIGVELMPTDAGFGAALDATWVGLQSQTLDDGRLKYSRRPLAVGLVRRFTPAGVVVDVEGGVALGWLHVTGRGFPANHDADDWSEAGFVSLRATTGSTLLRPFAGISGYGWLKSATAYVGDSGREFRLPAIELLFFAGIDVIP
jgi:hypothetical protein